MWQYVSHERTKSGVWLVLREKRWWWPFWVERRYVWLKTWGSTQFGPRWRRNDRDYEEVGGGQWLQWFVDVAEAEEAQLDEVLAEAKPEALKPVILLRPPERRAAILELERVMGIGRGRKDE